MKKTISAILALLAAAALLAGCNQSAPTASSPPPGTSQSPDGGGTSQVPSGSQSPATPSDDAEIERDSFGVPIRDFGGRTFRLLINAPDQKSEQGMRQWDRIEEIEELHNCTIVFLDQTNENQETLYSSILSGEPIADLAYVGGPSLYFPNVRMGYYYPIHELSTIDLDDPLWNKDVMGMYTLGDEIYGLYMGSYVWGHGLFVNTDLLARSGVTENIYDLQEKGEWTWDKFLEIAHKCTTYNDDGSPRTMGVMESSTSTLFMNNIIYSFGGSYMGVRDGKAVCTLDSPESLAALQFYQDLYLKEGVFMPFGDIVETRFQANSWFKDGRLAFYTDHVWNANLASMMDNYAVVKFPKHNDTIGNIACFDWPDCFFIPSTVEDPEAVGAFVHVYFGGSNPDIGSPEEGMQLLLSAYARYFRDERGLNETFRNSLLGIGVAFDNRALYIDGFFEWGTVIPVLNQIATGEKTPAQGIQEIKPVIDANIAERMGY